MAVGDFTGDGIPDLVAAGHATVDVLPGHGDGTFAAPIRHSANGTRHAAWRWPTSTATASSTSSRPTADAGTVSVLLGNGDGTLTLRRRRTPPARRPRRSRSATSTATAGRTWRRPNAGSNTVSVLLNDGDWPALTTPPSADQRRDRHGGQHRHRRGHLHRHPVRRLRTRPSPSHYATANGTATAGSDYQAKTGT